MWRVTIAIHLCFAIHFYFNPHPPCGGWLGRITITTDVVRISIHTLRVEGDFAFAGIKIIIVHFNPHPPCGGWHAIRVFPLMMYDISIHTLRVEGDSAFSIFNIFITDFNPHPPCGGWLQDLWLTTTADYFNPHPPCGGWQLQNNNLFQYPLFQSTPSVWRVTLRLMFIIHH